MKKLISSGGLIINKDKVLILKRDKTWVFPKGKIKEEEDLIETAKREIYEETGINVDNPLFFIGKTKYRFVKENEIYEKEVFYYLFKVDTLNVNIENSFIGYGWFYFDEGLRILTYKNDKKLLKIAIKKLKEANL